MSRTLLLSLEDLRERILARGLLGTVVVGGLALPPNLWASAIHRSWWVGAGDVLVYAWVVALWRARAMTYRQRAIHFAVLLHLLGAMLVLALGPSGAGLVWILGANTLGAVLLGTRAAWLGLAFEALLLAGAGALFGHAEPFWIVPLTVPAAAWALFSANTLVLSAICSLSVASLLSGLATSIDARDAAHDALAAEQQRMRAANAALELEAARRARAEAQLRQAQKLEAVGTLAGGIAHDFNNLLQPIVLLAAVARDGLPLDSPVRADLDDIEAAAVRGRELVRRILHFSRKSTAERRPVRLSVAIEESVRLLSATLPASVRLVQRLETDDDHVHADPTELHQIILNLATNAAHAMRGRGGVLTLTVRDTDDAAQLLLTVTDEGEGMDAATAERVFEPFFTTKPAGEGSGLGLSVVHGLVGALGGTIRVDSAPGRGTEVHVMLPRCAAASATDPVAAPTSSGAARLRILLVDDDAQVQAAMTRGLDASGHHVTAVTAPERAVALFAADPWAFDAVVTDYTMPRMNGLELAAVLRRSRPSVPIVLYTGRVEPGVDAAASEARVRLLAKPVDLSQLVDVLMALVEQARGARAG